MAAKEQKAYSKIDIRLIFIHWIAFVETFSPKIVSIGIIRQYKKKSEILTAS